MSNLHFIYFSLSDLPTHTHTHIYIYPVFFTFHSKSTYLIKFLKANDQSNKDLRDISTEIHDSKIGENAKVKGKTWKVQKLDQFESIFTL